MKIMIMIKKKNDQNMYILHDDISIYRRIMMIMIMII